MPTQPMKYDITTTVNLPFDAAVEATQAALKNEGFGVLTTIDVQATLKEKIGVDFERYLILGACNPTLAHRALTAEHNLGLLLPCNVIVHEHGDGVTVSAVDPHAMMAVAAGNPDLEAVADEAAEKLGRAIAAIGS